MSSSYISMIDDQGGSYEVYLDYQIPEYVDKPEYVHEQSVSLSSENK